MMEYNVTDKAQKELLGVTYLDNCPICGQYTTNPGDCGLCCKANEPGRG